MVRGQIARITITVVEIDKRDWRRGAAIGNFLGGDTVVGAVLVEKHVVVFKGEIRDEDTSRGRRRCGTDGCRGCRGYDGGRRFGGEVDGIKRDDRCGGRDCAGAACAFGDDVAGDLGGVGRVAGYNVSIVGIRVGIDGAGGFGG